MSTPEERFEKWFESFDKYKSIRQEVKELMLPAYLAATEDAARIAEDGYFDIAVGPNDEVCDAVELTRATIAAAIRKIEVE